MMTRSEAVKILCVRLYWLERVLKGDKTNINKLNKWKEESEALKIILNGELKNK